MNRKKQILLICRLLKAWRIKKKLSQEMVYNSTRIDVSKYEKERCEPGLYNLMQLCDFYGCSLPWLLKKVEDIDGNRISEQELLNLIDNTDLV